MPIPAAARRHCGTPALRRIGAAAAGLLTATALAGCAGGSTAMIVPADPVAAVRSAAAATSTLHSADVATSTSTTVDGSTRLFTGTGAFDFDHSIGTITLSSSATGPTLQEVVTPTTLYLKPLGDGPTGSSANWLAVNGASLADGDVISAGYTSPMLDFALLRGVAAGQVHYVGPASVRGVEVSHYSGVLDLTAAAAAAAASPPVKAALQAAAHSFDRDTVPFDAYVDAQGLVRRVVAHFAFPATAPQTGEVSVVTTTDLYALNTPVSIATPSASPAAAASRRASR